MQGRLWQDLPVSRSCHAAHDQGRLIMNIKQIGSAKKNLHYHNVLILLQSKNQTVKDQSIGEIKSLFFRIGRGFQPNGLDLGSGFSVRILM